MFCVLIRQALFLFLFLFFGYTIGRVFLKEFSFYNSSEAYAFSTAIGWGGLVFLMTFLGLLGWLKPFILFPTLAILFVACSWVAIQNKYSRFGNLFQLFKKNLSLSFFIPVIFFILLFYLTAYPVTQWDAISYHLPVAREFVSQGKIVPLPFLRFPVFPQLIEMFFVLALMFNNPLFANLTQYAMAMVLAFLIYSFCRRFFNKEIGLLSAFVFLSSPIVSKLAVVPYVEIGATLFCFSAFYAMIIWVNERKLNYGMLSAIFWGLAFSSKYYAILFFLIIFPITIIIFRKKIRWTHLLPMLSVMLLIALPWYFRNKAYTGDWFFPLFMNRISSGGFWNTIDFNSQMEQIRSLTGRIDFEALFELGKNMGPFIMVFLGSFLFVKKRSCFITEFILIAIIYTLIWFYKFQEIRYLFPVLPILSILSGWTLNKAVKLLNLCFWRYLFIVILIFGCVNCIKIIGKNKRVPCAVDEKNKYLANHIPTYGAINFLNNIEQKDVVVYALFDEASVFYHENKVIGDWFGPAAYRNVLPYIEKPVLLHRVLRDYGVRYFLINRGRVGRVSYKLENDLFKLVYKDENAFVFEVI